MVNRRAWPHGGRVEFSGRSASLTRCAAFTLIELMLVIAIIGIIAAIPISLIIEALGLNSQPTVIESLRTVALAQTVYRGGDLDANGVNDYAPSLSQLAGHCSLNGTFDPCGPPNPNLPFFYLPPSQYSFQMLGTEPPPNAAFRVLAAPKKAFPHHPLLTIDETGRIFSAFGKIPTTGDTVVDEGTGDLSNCAAGCEGDITIAIHDLAAIAAFEAALRDLATNTILQLASLITPGQLIPEPDPIRDAAILLSDSTSVEEPLLLGLDADGSGLDFASFLNADLFDLSRTLAATLPAGSPTAPPSPTVATDASVAALIATYQDDLATALEFDPDSTPPKVPSAELTGDPVAFLLAILAAAVPSLGAKGLLFVSAGLVALGTYALSRRRRLTGAVEDRSFKLRPGEPAE